MRRRKVLIVDDEEPIVFGLLRVLYQDNDTADVLLASTGEIARQIMVENEIDVMVTDMRLPGMSGLDLLCWASSEGFKTRVIVITAFDIAGIHEMAYRFGCLKILQKPFDAHALREMVRNALERVDTFTGSLTNLSPADVIQMLCLGQKTTTLHVNQEQDFGRVVIEEGEIVHATWNALKGEDAFHEILRATHGMFSTLPFPEDTPRTISREWQHLLIEGMRREDERRVRRDPAAPEPPAEVPVPDSQPADDDFADDPAAAWDRAATRRFESPRREAQVAKLTDEGFQRLRRHDVAGARAAWEQACQLDPDNRMLQLNLRRLQKLEK
jgi:DNA-binding response OmpR family regulator